MAAATVMVLALTGIPLFAAAAPAHDADSTEYRCAGSDSETVTGKPRRGHYVALNRQDNRATLARVAKPGVRGVQKRYRWRELEPERGQYAFEELRADLDMLGEHDLSLVAFIEDKTFDSGNPLPEYLSGFSLENRRGGYTAMRWHPTIVERMSALLAAVGDAFDCHPRFEGIAIQESALGLDESARRKAGYTPEAYRDALINILTEAAGAMPASQVFWYMNYLPGGQSHLPAIARAVAPAGVAMGGPDVLPDSEPLERMVYPLYRRFRGDMPLFGSLQNDSFAHKRRGASSEEFWSLEELYRFARDELHVDYLFWNRKTWQVPRDSHDFDDALDVIERHADFAGDSPHETRR